MKYIASAITALLASSLASAAVIGQPIKRAQTCTATLTGANSEGGGGPGQSPIDYTTFGLSTGKTGLPPTANEFCTDNGGGAISCQTIDHTAYLGTYDTTCSGQWNYENNSWTSCTCNKVNGAIQGDSICSGTVSVTTDTCTATYDC